MSTDDAVARARSAHADRRWATAFAGFTAAEHAGPLALADLGRLAEYAYLLHRWDDYFAARELAHQRHLDAGDLPGAVITAVWIAVQHLHDGVLARGTGWLQRAERLAAGTTNDTRVDGYLALARAFPAAGAGEVDAAARLADEAAAAGHRCGDVDLAALALQQAGVLHLGAGRVDQGCARMDEAMVLVTADRVTPLVTGLVYCGVISGCWQIYDIGRAHEWTAAMTGWCAAQPEMDGFVGECRVRRAELSHLHGDWTQAAAALTGVREDVDRGSAGLAAQVRGDLDRLRGRLADAEQRYAAAARLGREPQPGLALLRLTRGSSQAAAAMLRRSLTEVRDSGRRVPILAAATEAFVAVNDMAAATAAVEELTELGRRQDSAVVRAVADQAQARLALALGNADRAGRPARNALETWLRVGVPYEEARTRVLLATACQDLGDAESAARERRTAREIFQRLGARPDLDALDHRARHVLTAREIEVLRLVATGATNRAIAERLFLSERTVDRHVSNIFTKLDVATRSAATARAGAWQLL